MSHFAIAFLFLPPERRRGIEAVYAFCRTADDAVDEARDAAAARTRLAAARRLLDRVYAGEADGPDAARLAFAVRRFALPRGPFDALLEGVAWDLEGHRYATREDLRAYAWRVASSVGLQCVRVFGCAPGACDRYAEELGVAFQWTNVLRDVGVDRARGRVYLPDEVLDRHGLRDVDLAAPSRDARVRLSALVREEADYARGCFRAARAALPPSERRRVLAGEIMAAVYGDLLDAVERMGDGVLDRTIRVPTPRRARLALRTWARSRLGIPAGGP